MILMCCLMLVGCSNKTEEVKEYPVDEFSNMYWEIFNYGAKEFEKLTDEEQYGGKQTPEERTAFAISIYAKLQKEKMDEYGFKYNVPIKIRGKVSQTPDSDTNFLKLDSLDNDSDCLFINIKMIDDISSLQKDDVVVIQAEFLEDSAGLAGFVGNGKIISK